MSLYKYGFLPMLLLALGAGAQAPDTTVRLNDLQAPVSPASNLLGFAPSEVESPTDPHKLMLSLANASNSFSVLPGAYALDIAPFKLLPRNGIKLSDIDSKRYRDVFRQSLVMSFAFRRPADESADTAIGTQVGIGVKFALLRGRVNSDFQQAVEKVRGSLRAQNRALADGRLDACVERNTQYKRLDTLIRQALANSQDISVLLRQKNELKDQLIAQCMAQLQLSDVLDSVKAQVLRTLEGVTLDRYGAFADLSCGVSYSFPGNRAANSRPDRAGAWLTFGYREQNAPLTVSGIIRYLYSPEVVYADAKLGGQGLQTLDGGGKLSYRTADSRFSLSVEAIYRSVDGSVGIASSWRAIGNADYALRANQRLTISFGRNFDGSYYRGGNLVASINFIAGLGRQSLRLD